MALHESDRLAGKRRFLFAVLCPVVCDRETEKSRRAIELLVAESDWFATAVVLRIVSARFGFYFRVRFHLDSVHPQPDDRASTQESASNLHGLRG